MQDDSHTHASLLLQLGDSENSEAWERFVLQYGPIIYDWCLYWKLQPADAEDVTQGLILKLFHLLRTFKYNRDQGSFRGWLKTLTRNAVHDFFRRHQRMVNADSDVWRTLKDAHANDDLAYRLDQAHQDELLKIAENNVKQRVAQHTWKAFELSRAAELSVSEIAQESGLQIAMVYVAKSKVIRMLKQEIASLGESVKANHE